MYTVSSALLLSLQISLFLLFAISFIRSIPRQALEGRVSKLVSVKGAHTAPAEWDLQQGDGGVRGQESVRRDSSWPQEGTMIDQALPGHSFLFASPSSLAFVIPPLQPLKCCQSLLTSSSLEEKGWWITALPPIWAPGCLIYPVLSGAPALCRVSLELTCISTLGPASLGTVPSSPAIAAGSVVGGA